ncbi:glycosyltransferase [Hydrogenimonas thermophila]|uniref:glycosyltransferase family 2 protein n=1 Tax=Hydrogenimonas thermophila TaxID=223786 RepID=UPI002936DB7A|nr:glycosyltransferase [Hydrogenimonas thermophila]WOE70113.1 glycosyltransferase [Hydrogenimonas thermophila]WOE72630.1 glycosyltransferase [Hydrogenimonas thermophila]
MSEPLVSVIMSVYNDSKFLNESIESILNQSYKNFEFIIVNDGSSDSSLNVINEYAKKDNRIVVIDQKNKGLTKSLNIAIKKSNGDFIARMDADDISCKNRLKEQVKFLVENKEFALVGTNIIKIDQYGNFIEKNKTKYSDSEIRKTFCTRNCIAHGSVMLNRKLLGNILYYDENFKYSQDYRLWTKIARHYKIANLKESLYKLRVHNKSISKQKIEEQSIYAGVVAYEFENNEVVNNLKDEVNNNIYLRKKIGLILLMNFEPKIAMKYFSRRELYYWISFFATLIDLKKIKNLVKLFK